ncbi:hypothetical protein EDD85DRAFT_794160 [Armillaria nabsnona]|nr:hypothetical protein EDD85DRAFT_794160 [Armillaria nabsnona]
MVHVGFMSAAMGQQSLAKVDLKNQSILKRSKRPEKITSMVTMTGTRWMPIHAVADATMTTLAYMHVLELMVAAYGARQAWYIHSYAEGVDLEKRSGASVPKEPWYCLANTCPLYFSTVADYGDEKDLFLLHFSGMVTLMICFIMIATVVFGYRQWNKIVVIPIGTVFTFTQLRSTIPGAPKGFGASVFSGLLFGVVAQVATPIGGILDYLGLLPCLILLLICAVTMVGIYLFTDPHDLSCEAFTWDELGQFL